MDTHSRPGDNSGEPRSTRLERRHLSSIGTQNMSLRDRFDLDRPRSAHGDDKHRARNHVGNPSHLSSGNHSKQRTRRINASDADELVKHMANLPSYLERAGKPQEKAFSVGVLDWGLLEKWQSSKQLPYRSDGSSSSNSNSSSLFSTGESSTYSQTGHSSAASYQSQHQFPSEACVSYGKSHNVSKNQPGPRAESVIKVSTSSSKTEFLGAHEPSVFSEGQRHSYLERQVRKSRRSQSMSLNHKSTEKDEKPVLVRPLDDCSTVSVTKGLKATTSQRNSEEKNKNRTEKYNKSRNSEFSRDIPHSCPLPCNANDQTIRVLRLSRSQDAKAKDSATADGSQLLSPGECINPLKEGSSKYNNPFTVTELPTVADLPQKSRISKQPVDATNARYPSPTGQFSLRIGTANRKSSYTEDAALLQASCTHTVDRPHSNKAVHSSSTEKLSCEKSAAGKARSSPLKRLLEPLLKPKEATENRCSASMKKDSILVNNTLKRPDRPSTAPGIREGLNLNNDKSSSIHRSHQNEKHNESAVLQALLQVVVQNGCPLFTFAVDGVKDILCAAMSKLGSGKTSEDGYLYTFFSIQEIKNKSWMNLRGKGSGHEYSPNVVAQMEVSETQLSKSTGSYILRQFVLSNVDLKPGGKSEYQLNDEVAAVAVCLPSDTNERMQSDNYSRTTVILPNGVHTLPSKGKPSSLIERWRSGGQCDCGGWDPGCKLRILTDSKFHPSSSLTFKLYDQGVVERVQQPVFNLAPFKDKEGVLSVSFSSSILPLQAFSVCLAVLNSKKGVRPPTPAKVQEAKSLDETSRDEVPGSYFSVPPHSPVGRV